MIKIGLDTWISISTAYKELSNGVKKVSLQWFPFTKLSEEDWEYLCSEDFYFSFIQNGAFILFQNVMHISENYIQKSDGSFRDATLISPLLYIIFQALGAEIEKVYCQERPRDISVYYAGNYDELDIRYKHEYDSFFKELNAYQEDYDYYIKTDITSFFQNINIDKLIDQLDKNSNKNEVVLTQVQLQFLKEILVYAGQGKFPLVENSIMSSYLATFVYLDKIDSELYDFLEKKVIPIRKFKIVRYVDDMYILISLFPGNEDVGEIYAEIRNEYSSILKEWGLALNSKKCKLGLTKDINQDLKKSLYDEGYNGEKHCIEELFPGSLEDFLRKLLELIESEFPDSEQYNDLIEDYFSCDDIEFTADEVFNYFVYESEHSFESCGVAKVILSIIKKNIAVLSLDPKRLGVLVMKTHNDTAIKATLNELFTKYRADKWNSYDTTIAIAYLIQSKFQHIDLLAVLRKKAPKLYEYYYNNCRGSFMKAFSSRGSRITKTLCEVIGKDWKSFYLFFMYTVEAAKNNNLTAYAFFKNFFDRLTADLDHIKNIYDGIKEKKPNYKAFYKEKIITDFYSCIEESERIIKKAHQLRNANPVSHSSAYLIENEHTSEDLENIIEELKTIIKRYITQNDISDLFSGDTIEEKT